MSLLNRVQWVLREKRSVARADRWPAGVVAILVPIFLTFGLPHVASVADEETTVVVETIQAAATVPADVFKTPDSSQVVEPTQEDVSRRAQLQIRNRRLQILNRRARAPSELNKVALPDYVIEPPDILLIDGIRILSSQESWRSTRPGRT